MSGTGTTSEGTAGTARTEASPAAGGTERWKERGVALRVGVYVFATHLFAGFIWVLFYVGEHAKK
ncbi:MULTISPECIES: DUF6126 family protein [unclassified Streptomyces]|uniref:DUF6126 family protein n=1 Tax=unclassified Streptomyces TaxID=2593676 RepID=UPI000DAEA9D8|nr:MULTISPECIES: DUF6126 family protein [unclassified Streptomyces]PZT72759.1 hypothetical protein DNK55_30245 [Streptomyces sp. AC1-42T]PZT80922.1 hypothetical protein DNK56_01325 [Streptomyces sp. AC1-42W]